MSVVRPPRGLWQCEICLAWNRDGEESCGKCDTSRHITDRMALARQDERTRRGGKR